MQLAELANRNGNDIVGKLSSLWSVSEHDKPELTECFCIHHWCGQISWRCGHHSVKSNQQGAQKVHLVDDSNCQVNVTLWGKQTSFETFDR